MNTFDLIDAPWIPVRTEHTVREVSLRDVLINAHQFERIEDASPLVVASLHRLLLAVLHRALKGPEDFDVATTLVESGTFSAEAINTYLDAWQHRFDLFSEGAPFYQVAKADGVNTKPISNIAIERASGTNKLLFDHSIDEQPPNLRPAEAARLVIARQSMAIPEGAGYSPSPVGGTALVLPFGSTLFETLCLNLVEYPEEECESDLPVWEMPVPTPASIAEQKDVPIAGLTHRYTWLSRVLTLIPENDNGQTVVRWVHYAKGSKVAEGGKRPYDPMVAYRKDEKRGLLPVGFRLGRGFWRDFQALILAQQSPYIPPAVIEHAAYLDDERGLNQSLPTMVLGLSNEQKPAKVEMWRSEVFFLPSNLARDEAIYPLIEEALGYADKVGSALHKGAWRMATDMLTVADRTPDKGDVSNLIRSLPLDTTYWTALETDFAGLLERLQRSYTPQSIQDWWHTRVEGNAWRAWQQATRSLGTNGRALRAANEGTRAFAGSLAKLQPEQPAA